MHLQSLPTLFSQWTASSPQVPSYVVCAPLHVCMRRPEVGLPWPTLLLFLSFWDGFLCIALAVLELPTQGRDWRRVPPHLTPTYFLRHFLLNLEYITISAGWTDQPVLGVPHPCLLCGDCRNSLPCPASQPGSHDTAAISRPSSSNSLNRVNCHLLSFSQPKILNMSSRKLPLTSETISIYLWIYRTSQWPQTAAHNL